MEINKIIEEVNKVPGWFDDKQMRFLFPYAQKFSDIVEIGTYAGRSTLFWALCNSKARIITIDNCVGVPSNGINGLTIDEKIIGSGNILAIHEDSHQLVKRFNFPISALFIDGSHHYADVCRDITDWLPKVKGIIVCHDYQDEWPEIKQACDNCLRGKYEVLNDKFGLFIVKTNL